MLFRSHLLTHTHTHSLTHTHTHTPTHSLIYSHTHIHSLTHSLPHTHSLPAAFLLAYALFGSSCPCGTRGETVAVAKANPTSPGEMHMGDLRDMLKRYLQDDDIENTVRYTHMHTQPHTHSLIHTHSHTNVCVWCVCVVCVYGLCVCGVCVGG